ncbi:hypothetical protein KNE206_45140 [Kitasatospora sp. NE20-6]
MPRTTGGRATPPKAGPPTDIPAAPGPAPAPVPLRRAAGAARAAVPAVVLLLFAVVTAVAVAHGGAPLAAERSAHAWMLAHRPDAAVRAVGTLTRLGTGLPPYLAAAAAGTLAARAARTTGYRLAALCAPAAVLAAGQLLRTGLMLALARPRPPVADWAGPPPGAHAYPSGHAFTAAVAAGLLAQAIGRTAPRSRAAPVRAVLLLVAAAVGVSRAYLGVHWPLDVVGGWLLAAAWLGLWLPLLGRLSGPAPPTGPAPRTRAARTPNRR